MKKGQMITFDMSTTIIIFIVFIILFLLLFFFAQKTEQKHEFELEYAFANLENNLRFGPADQAFLRNYRVNRIKLNNFADNVPDIDAYVLGEIEGAHGIGMAAEGYDSCLYFRDINGEFIGMGASDLSALGRLSKIGSTCEIEMITNNRNPCDRYKQALAMIKPVLMDESYPEINQIIQMNLVICKK